MLNSVALAAVLGIASHASLEPQGRPRQTAGLKVGSKAATFKLDLLEEGKSFELAAEIGKKPIVVVFGSYT